MPHVSDPTVLGHLLYFSNSHVSINKRSRPTSVSTAKLSLQDSDLGDFSEESSHIRRRVYRGGMLINEAFEEIKE